MKRWLLAVAALLGSAWTCAQADYVLIVYDLGVPKNKGGQQQGFPGMDGRAGPGGGMQDMMRRQMQRIQGGGGDEGRQGFGRPGGGGDGMRRMMQGQQPGGFQGGQPGGGFRGGMQPGGFQGGQPGGGRFGMNPFGGMNPLNLFGNQNLEEPDDEDATLKVSAVVEVQKWSELTIRKSLAQRPDQFKRFQHAWGKTALYDTGDISFKVFTIPPREKAYKDKRGALLGKEGSKETEKNPNNYLDLAKWALSNGKVDEFPKIMDELAKVDPDNTIVATFKKVKAEMDRKITKDDAAAYYWQNKLGNYKLKVDSEYPHYVLLHSPSTSGSADSPDVASRMKRLEENYRAFYYWFVLKGKVQSVPDYRLVAILVNKPEEYQENHKSFDNIPTADDGFYARRENLAFFSATPLDEGYEALDKSMSNLWKEGWTRKDLLDGKTKSPPNTDSVTIVRNQVMTLLLQALESESELAAVSHEGTMQLLSVTGAIPRTVSTPEWVRFGTASFFETPKTSWWQGTGAPSQLYLKKFKKWEETKKLDNPPETALKKVITDEYFQEAQKLNLDAAWTKARTMTWALTYYLAETHFDELLAYYQELAALPRDMDFDGEILMGCFARAFKIADPANPNQPKADALHRLGMDWYRHMAEVRLENKEAQVEADDFRNSKKSGAKKNTKAKESEK